MPPAAPHVPESVIAGAVPMGARPRLAEAIERHRAATLAWVDHALTCRTCLGEHHCQRDRLCDTGRALLEGIHNAARAEYRARGFA